jgi:hypothetical protein
MADGFLASGENNSQVSGGMPLTLVGNFYPAIDQRASSGLGLQVPWGGGILMRSAVPPQEVGSNGQDTSSMMSLVTSMAAARAPITNYNFQGLIGPQGSPGPAGPPGLGGLGGIGSYSSPLANISYPIWSSAIQFSSNSPDVGKVSWTAGSLRYADTTYNIAALATGTTDSYIYWDSNSGSTAFKTTDDLSVASADGCFVVCYNLGGTAYVVQTGKMIIGGMIADSTVDTAQLADGAGHIYTEAYNVDPITLSTGWLQILSAAITSGGKPLLIFGSAFCTDNAADNYKVRLRISRVGSPSNTVVFMTPWTLFDDLVEQTVSIGCVDYPGAVAATYLLEIDTYGKSTDQYGSQRRMTLLEHKGK